MADVKKTIEQFDKIIGMVDEIERKGKTAPYTSVNGNMFTMIRKDGVLGMRLSKEDRASFCETYHSIDFENYGSKIKEYVEVPESVLMNDDLMIAYLKRSFKYTKTLKAKATKKAVKKQANKPPKKLSDELGLTYRNGQKKAKLEENIFTSYFEDGSIKSSGQLVDDKMEGKWSFNRKGGQLLQTGIYENHVKNGDWIRYDSNNMVCYHVVFKAGKVTQKIV